MRIISGENVDLISPYPASEIDRAVQWFFQYSSYTGDDSSPKTPEGIKELLAVTFETNLTYGIIDKLNYTKSNHEAPLVGIINFAPQSKWNGYIHIASSRSAWGRKTGVRLADEASKLAIEDIWDQYPDLLRQSCLISQKNYPARHLAERVGFKIDGVMENFFVLNDKPMAAIHLGKLKVKESLDDGIIDSPGGGDSR